jgi:hypothetical protein
MAWRLNLQFAVDSLFAFASPFVTWKPTRLARAGSVTLETPMCVQVWPTRLGVSIVVVVVTGVGGLVVRMDHRTPLDTVAVEEA